MMPELSQYPKNPLEYAILILKKHMDSRKGYWDNGIYRERKRKHENSEGKHICRIRKKLS